MKSQEKLPRAMADYGKRFEQGLEQMSPFEIKNDLISYAKECDQKAVCQFLNAGRGNPNWINTVAREAFFLLGTFAVSQTSRKNTGCTFTERKCSVSHERRHKCR